MATLAARANEAPAVAPRAPENAPAPNAAPRHRLSHLSKYSGKRADWRTWELQARLKLETDHAAIGSAHDQVGYLFSSLESEPQQRLTLWVTQALQAGHANAKSFMEQAALVFGDPNEERNALNRLTSMKQGRRENLDAFLPKFESAMARAVGLSWPARVQINYLDNALNDDTVAQLVTVNTEGMTFAEYTTLLLTVDVRLQQLRLRRNHCANFGPSASAPPGNDGPAPMDCSAAQVQAQWVSQEVLRQRRENRQCLRCGNDNHIIRNCPQRPARRPARAAAAAVTEVEDANEELKD